MTAKRAIDDERAKLAQALKAARTRYDREYPQQQGTIASAERECQALEKRFYLELEPHRRAIASARRTMLDLDEGRGSAEFALRRSADPRIRVLDDAITECADRIRVHGGHEKMTALEALGRARVAKRALADLELALVTEAEVDVELRKIIEGTGFSLAELFQFGWRQ